MLGFFYFPPLFFLNREKILNLAHVPYLTSFIYSSITHMVQMSGLCSSVQGSTICNWHFLGGLDLWHIFTYSLKCCKGQLLHLHSSSKVFWEYHIYFAIFLDRHISVDVCFCCVFCCLFWGVFYLEKAIMSRLQLILWFLAVCAWLLT